MFDGTAGTVKLVVVLIACAATLVCIYLFAGSDVAYKLQNATYAKQTLAESGPYALSVSATAGVPERYAQFVDRELRIFLDNKGFELVDAQTAVDKGGSVLTIILDASPIPPDRSTFSVTVRVDTYVYRLGASGDWYRQSAQIYSSGKHGHAGDVQFGEAVSQTALMMTQSFLDQHVADNP